MTSHEIRTRFLDFFKARGHVVVPSASLVPKDDPTTLFTGSGMQPLLPYLLGEAHPEGKRVANSQRCFRAADIEEVGDNRHTTFFEMLGNWSFGDYWKEEQLAWVFEFFTKEVGIPAERLWVTCFEGDKKLNLPQDAESAEIWKKLGMPEERIRFYDSTKNWWSRAGVPEEMPEGEPGGPDSEVFYEFANVAHDPKFGRECHPNCDCGRFLEIGNSVFMEYVKTRSASSGQAAFEPLPQKNVDFGGGLERIAMAAQETPDIFETDLFQPVVAAIEAESSIRYDKASEEEKKSFRVVADHIRGVVFMLAEGVLPSNTGREYLVRRLVRRAVRHAGALRVEAGKLSFIAEATVDSYGGVYDFLESKRKMIRHEIDKEEKKFGVGLSQGLKALRNLGSVKRKSGSLLSGKDTFDLYQTYGLPPEVISEELEKYDMEYDQEEFQKELERHQELSQTASAGQFKGGLADTSDEVVRLHTATHLMNAALRKVLGEHVFQKGSNITKERTRFDFTHQEKMTDEEKQKVEELVNEWIQNDYEVKKEIMSREEAHKLGAIGVFGEKYPDKVNIYTVWDPETEEVISREFCGGPHVTRTGEIGGTFKLKKEQSVAAGVRRVKAVLT